MPADSRVTQSFPLEEEERDEPYRLSAERANSMNALAIPQTMAACHDFSVLKSELLDSLQQDPVRRKLLEQIWRSR
jgi:hypothetical protein